MRAGRTVISNELKDCLVYIAEDEAAAAGNARAARAHTGALADT